MAPYRQATDKNQQGVAYQIARALLEYSLVPDDLKRDRKLLQVIHGWIRALNPTEEIKPENCKETIAEIIKFNDDELLLTSPLTLYNETEVQLMDLESKEYFRNVLDGIFYRMQEIVVRGKLIDNVQAQQGSPMPL